MKEADIVVTNPPFSLLREYVAQLIEHDKQFLIIGNMNAIGYKEVFPFIKEGDLWLGVSGRVNHFKRPDGSTKSARGCWFTNFDYKKRYEEFKFDVEYHPDIHPRYDNYDAIEVSKTKLIPYDYDGVMGVPDSFLEKYNPNQFKILGVLQGKADEDFVGLPTIEKYDKTAGVGYVNGDRKFVRCLIQRV